jgi:hypothetical protein
MIPFTEIGIIFDTSQTTPIKHFERAQPERQKV